MERNTKEYHSQRLLSVHLLADNDDDDHIDQKNGNELQTQYATPMAQINENNQIDTKPILLTTNQVQVSAAQNQRLTTTTTKKIEEIDLTTPIKSQYGLSQRDYLPYTLTALNQERLSILPAYPPSNNDNDQLSLLLTSIPINQLSQQELARRQHGTYKCQFSINNHNISTTSFFIEKYNLYYGSIMERLHIDLSIVDYNYLRLKKFIQLCRLAYIRVLPSSRCLEMNLNLQETEYPQLMEFYLQTDIDLFYMKTCSFRQAKPRIDTEGIFCTTTPECRYVMEPCGHCLLCNSLNQSTSRPQYSVAFNLYQKHRFVNGYESILNCPASCNTNNIIYVLTCQCGNYDYIGETNGNLLRRLSNHQCFTHRLILETLVGEANYMQFWGVKTEVMAKKDSMRLYQHPLHCSSAMQSFLNQNMDYWIFVPMLNEEANQENIHHTSGTTLPLAARINNGNMLKKCLDSLPKPPTGYKFTKYQIKKQYEFFKMNLYEKQTSVNYIIYHATVIAILPLNTSEFFRRIIYSLFITHAETKLNTLAQIFTYHLDDPINQSIWCANLRHPRHQL